MKHNLCIKEPLVLLFVIILTGCASDKSRIISESIQIPPGWWDYSPEDMTYNDGYGAKRGDCNKLWDGIKIIRVALIETENDYIFEINTLGNLEVAAKAYDNRLTFQITGIPGKRHDRPHIGTAPALHIAGGWSGHVIFTTRGLKQAVLIESAETIIEASFDKNNNVTSAKMISPSKEISRLNVKVVKDRMQIFIPKKCLSIKGSSEWGSWTVCLRAAILPVPPMPTEIKDVFYSPVVYRITFPLGRTTYIQETLYSKKDSEK